MSDSAQFNRLPRALLRIPVPWVFVLTYLIGAALETVLQLGRLLEYRILTPTGSAMFVIGATLAGWGWMMFHRAGTTRVPGETSIALVTWGPYRFTRNPMYLGLSVAYVGEAGILHHIIPVILLPLTIAYLNRVVIPVEEKRLQAVFGVKYERYANTVRRWL
jgi:protein-S-isoprenylcysteine O-methyltransferase Ste14